MKSQFAFVVAMEQELSPFLRRVGPSRRSAIGGFKAYELKVFERESLLVVCGIGAKRAAEATGILLDACRPSLMVSFGASGAAAPLLRVADVVVPHSVRRFESGVIGPPRRLAGLSDGAAAEAAHLLGSRGAGFYRGTLITTRGEDVAGIVADGLELPIFDMETAGIAEVASEHGVPVLSIRSISDSIEEPLPFSVAGSLDAEDNLRIGRIIASAARDPRRLLRLASLRKNMQRATENMTVALFVALRRQIESMVQ